MVNLNVSVNQTNLINGAMERMIDEYIESFKPGTIKLTFEDYLDLADAIYVFVETSDALDDINKSLAV